MWKPKTRGAIYRVVNESKWSHNFYDHNKQQVDEHGWLWLYEQELVFRSVATGELKVWMRDEMEEVNGDRKGLPRN